MEGSVDLLGVWAGNCRSLIWLTQKIRYAEVNHGLVSQSSKRIDQNPKKTIVFLLSEIRTFEPKLSNSGLRELNSV